MMASSPRWRGTVWRVMDTAPFGEPNESDGNPWALDLPAVTGMAGIEVFNGGTVLDSHKGEALTHWDEGLARGGRWWGIAVDDTHWHSIDRGLGWVVVRAAEPTPRALLAALARGHFY